MQRTGGGCALLQFEEVESGQKNSVWVPFEALEWPDRWCITQFPQDLVLNAGARKPSAGGVANLTVDVSVALSRVLARHVLVQVLYGALSAVLTHSATSSGGASSKPLFAVCKALDPTTLLNIVHLLLPSIELGASSAGGALSPTLRTLCGMPLTPPEPTAPPGLSREASGLTSPKSPSKDEKAPGLDRKQSSVPVKKAYGELSHHARGVVWDTLRLLIVHSNSSTPGGAAVATLMGADFTAKLLPLLVNDMVRHLKDASFRVKEIESQHPYTSGIKVFGLIRLENVSDVLLQFDRRCNFNLAHATYVCYSDHKAGKQHSFLAPFILPLCLAHCVGVGVCWNVGWAGQSAKSGRSVVRVSSTTQYCQVRATGSGTQW